MALAARSTREASKLWEALDSENLSGASVSPLSFSMMRLYISRLLLYAAFAVNSSSAYCLRAASIRS